LNPPYGSSYSYSLLCYAAERNRREGNRIEFELVRRMRISESKIEENGMITVAVVYDTSTMRVSTKGRREEEPGFERRKARIEPIERPRRRDKHD